jgi:hypothetical protein
LADLTGVLARIFSPDLKAALANEDTAWPEGEVRPGEDRPEFDPVAAGVIFD